MHKPGSSYYALIKAAFSQADAQCIRTERMHINQNISGLLIESGHGIDRTFGVRARVRVRVRVGARVRIRGRIRVRLGIMVRGRVRVGARVR